MEYRASAGPVAIHGREDDLMSERDDKGIDTDVKFVVYDKDEYGQVDREEREERASREERDRERRRDR